MAKGRIDKLISSQTGISRSDVRRHIRNKEVYINGALCTDPSFKADTDNDEITISGERLIYREHIYLMLNKPEGVVSAVSDRRYPTAVGLVPKELMRKGISVCGRLDIDTTGLLILTDDGAFVHDIISPNKDMFKTYEALLDRDIDEEFLKKAFDDGIVITDRGESYRCKRAYFRRIGKRLCEIRISEGRYHQIKKMCSAVGYGVVKLKRTAVGELRLDESLEKGQIRELTLQEQKLLMRS